MLNLKRLQYLDAVYQYKNFTQASEALYVSQPAISSAVQALEEELGCGWWSAAPRALPLHTRASSL
ncbi:MAG: LysR family transcriptional regulator [Dysosmobacter welbionis]